MGYTAKQKSLAIIPKCTGLLSLLGSAYILYDVLVSPRKRSDSVYHRIVLALSISDMMASIVNVLSTWPIPADTPNVYGASGNTETCTAQGLFNEMGNISTPLFNASLCTYYYVVIRRGWPERRIQKIERRFYIPPILVGLFMGFVGLPLKLYNNSGWLCWIAPYPSGCHLTVEGCTRGQLANMFRWIHYAIIWSAIFYVTIGMFLIYREVRNKERKTRRFTIHESPQSRMVTAIQRAAQEALEEDGDLYNEEDDDHDDDMSNRGGDLADYNHDDDDDFVDQDQGNNHTTEDGFEDEEHQVNGNGTAHHNNNNNNTHTEQQEAADTGCLGKIKKRLRGKKNTQTDKEREDQEYAKRRQKKSKTRKVADQAMLFVGALYLTWIFTTLTRIFQITQGKTYYPLLVLMAIFFPLQGFFNASIYLRPRYLRIRTAHPDLSLPRVLYCVLKYRDEDGTIFMKQPSTSRSSSLTSFFNLNSSGGTDNWISRRFSGFYNRSSWAGGKDHSGNSRRMSESNADRRPSSSSSVNGRRMSNVSGRFSFASGKYSTASGRFSTGNASSDGKHHTSEDHHELKSEEELQKPPSTKNIRWEVLDDEVDHVLEEIKFDNLSHKGKDDDEENKKDSDSSSKHKHNKKDDTDQATTGTLSEET